MIIPGSRFIHAMAAVVLLATPIWSAETITLTPSTATPALGASFTVTVSLSGAAPFANWATYLAWDPTKLQLTAQAAGGFSTFIADSRSLTTINGGGSVHAGGFAFSNNAGGSNSLGVFTFTALTSGATTITTAAKSVGNPFGVVLVDAAAAERIPGLPGPLTITVGPGATAPELDVTRSGSVADGGTDSVSGSLASSASVLTYTLANSGTASLSITGSTTVANQVNCVAVVTTQPAASVAASASTSLVVSVTPSSAGAWSFTLSTPNSDGNENPYNWTVSGTASASPAPELDVTRTGAVADGGTDTIAGSAAGSPSVLTYTLANNGTASLSITGATTVASLVNCTASVTTQPAASVAVSSSTTLVVSVTPSAAGAWSVVVSTPSNDGNENPYNWTIRGTVGGSGTQTTSSGSGSGGGGCGAGGLAAMILATCFAFRLRKGRTW